MPLPAMRTSSIPPVGRKDQEAFDSRPKTPDGSTNDSPVSALYQMQMDVAAEGARTAADVAKFGDMYYTGDGVPPDPEKAFKYWKRAALDGHAPSQYRVGVAYRDGAGIPPADVNLLHKLLETVGCNEMNLNDEPGQSIDAALRWFELAADQNHTLALIACGDIHYRGYGLTYQDSTLAFEYYSRAVESEPTYTRPVMDASLRLAAMLRSGDGTATNILRAYDLFHEAAEAQLQGEDFGARFYRMAKISAAELRKEIDDQSPVLGKRVEVAIPTGFKHGVDRNTMNVMSIVGQRGKAVNFDREFLKYAVEFDINPGQTAKIKPQYLKVVDEGEPTATQEIAGLEHARAAGARSPASVYEANKARSGL